MQMKIAVMGTGGVGGYFGSRLAAAGYDVTFIARGEHLAAISRDGLKIESENGDLHISPIQATDSPADVGPVDYVVFAVKLWDTVAAAKAIRPLIGGQTAVISLQNGVNAEHQLSDVLGAAHVMGGIAQIAAVIAAPGIIRHTGTLANLVFGELSGERSQRSENLLAAFQTAGVNAEISDDIEKTIWQKFVFLVGLSALTSLTGHSIGPVREDSHTRKLLVLVMKEAVVVAKAKGIDIDDEFVDDRLELIDTLPANMSSSMQQDLKRGNRLELDWLSGAVVRMGEELGVDTPANRFVYTALKLSKDGTD
jgi:2-dehydropantoate 2-reductase